MQTDSEEDEVHHQEPEKEIACCSTSKTTDPEGLVELLREEMEVPPPSSVSNIQEIVQEELDWKDPALWPDVLKDKDRGKIVIGGLRKEEELKEMIKEHENSIIHKQHYWSWRKLQMSMAGHGVDSNLQKSLETETNKFSSLLERLLDVTLFLASRNLAFRGSSQRIGDQHNGNFLGLLELIAHYDPVLQEHLEEVKKSQETGKKLHAHYLSWATQNEFINLCGKYVYNEPGSEDWTIQERFIEYFDFFHKTGEEIAEMLLSRLHKHGINVKDCRGQGFDNGANMSGKNKGARARIQEKYPKAIFCPCASHSLNLVGVHAASCCPDMITFFGCVNRLYTLFSGSPERWNILKETTGGSLHGLSDTRWSARIEAVRPIAQKLPSILESLEKILSSRKLSSEAHSEAVGLKNYFSSFKAVILATFWVKVLQCFEDRNKIIQSRSISPEIGAENIKALSAEMQLLRERWLSLLSEAKHVAGNLEIPTVLKTQRSRQRQKKQHTELGSEDQESEEEFNVNVFSVALDSVISELNQQFNSMENVCSLFAPILKLRTISDEELVTSTENLISKYPEDLTVSLLSEIQHLRKVFDATFASSLGPLDLLKSIYKLQLEGIFGEVCIALRIFATLPLSVAEGERAFSKLSLIKNYLRSTMSENRLNSLAILSIEHELARTLNFKDLITDFAILKIRRWSTQQT
ncbi:zinc finger MYM-type 1-like [Pelobates cultripes]|uniref:Zinc finger MYM-type 1-like n=1 Tax=Pelobates cultripes TaxID=61616 RepID=A0AAD1RIB4_PELCU|nr:zinc finger MYM-type 1-like [Pelobates cultripes]